MGTSRMTPEGYLPRVVDEQVERYLGTFGAVEIAGTKWCGKTWTALAHGASVSYVDDDLDLARRPLAHDARGAAPRHRRAAAPTRPSGPGRPAAATPAGT